MPDSIPPLVLLDFGMDAESGTETSPSAIPLFPLPVAGNSRTVRIGACVDLVSLAPEGRRREEPGTKRVPAAGSCTLTPFAPKRTERWDQPLDRHRHPLGDTDRLKDKARYFACCRAVTGFRKPVIQRLSSRG
jgi:hypothetical protein